MINLPKHIANEANRAVDPWAGADGERAVMLTTFRRDGTPVPTPVGYAIAGDDLYFMTDARTGKVKRLRRDPHVQVAPSTLRGRVTGPARDAVAVPLEGDAGRDAQGRITSRNRLAWFFLLRRAAREGRRWQVYVVRRPDVAAESADVLASDGGVATAAVPDPGRRVWSWAGVGLVVLAVGQIVSGALSGLFGNAFTTPDRAGEPPIVPAGYTFSIWGVIEVLSLALAVWLFVRRRAAGPEDRRVIDALTRPLLVVFAGFSAWIAAAELEPVWSTLVVFVIMVLALLRALSVARGERGIVSSWSRLGRFLVSATLGLYTGWSTIAIWLNLTTALAGSGAPIAGTVGVLGQLGVLLGATAAAVVLVRWLGGSLAYAAAVCWALVGAVIGARAAGQPALAVAAAVGLVVVAAVTAVVRWTQPASGLAD
jgi:PPOX class probable F420-dependent enzyme